MQEFCLLVFVSGALLNDTSLATLVKQIPFCSPREYGRLFSEVYKGNFYDLDPLMFSPAEVWLCNSKSGHSFHAGVTRLDILSHSFGLIN